MSSLALWVGRCPWRLVFHLRPTSWFTYDFGEPHSSDDPVDFNDMYQAARSAAGVAIVKLYAHNVADSSVRASVCQRRVQPHPRKVVQMGVTLTAVAESPNRLGESFRSADVLPDVKAFARPAWRVKLSSPAEVQPTPDDQPLSWHIARKTILEPGHCVRVTTSLK